MNTFKRFFALILTLCMVLSYVPVGAQAAETGPVSLSGTPQQPADAGVSGASQPFPLELFTELNSSSNGHFRIPAIVTLNDGTLVAAADARWQGWDTQDDNGNIDSVVSYSKDGGATWEVTFGNYFTSDAPFVEDWGSPTIIDPGLLTDGNKVYMIADLFPGQADGAGNCSANAQYAVGYDSQGRMLLRANGNTNDTGYYLAKYDDGTGKTYYKIYAADGTEQADYIVDAWFNLYQNGTYVRNLFERSTDSFMPIMTPHLYLTVGEFNAAGELVWSEPTMLNPILRSASEKYYLVSPGRGIMTSDGILVIGGYGNSSGGERASIIFFDGQNWHRSSTEASSVSSESEIVELNDGTLRMFVRHSGNGNYVQYIDWTPVKDSNGNVTDYRPGTAKNTTAEAHNNTNVAAIAYSRTSGGQQVLLVSTPTDISGAWTRKHGQIFTFLVDDETKELTLVKSYEVNGANDDYSYSCLTEQSDGSIALLYEKGDGGNITYVNLDAETVTGLTFDEYNIFVDGIDNSASVSVQVTVSSNVTHIHTQQNTNVSAITGTYTAYDVVLCTDAEESCTDGLGCANTYTNAATVTIPISAETAGKHLKGFVVNDNGTLTYVEKVEIRRYPNGNYTVSFKAPHFSTVGVKALTDEEIATDRKTIDIVVGQTHTEYLNEEEYTGSKNDTTANVAWGVVDHVVTYPSAKLGTDANFGGDTIDLNDCLYTFTENADSKKWVISAEVNGNTVYVDPHYKNSSGTNVAGYPNRPDPSDITIALSNYTGTTDGAFTFADGTGSLHFHSSGSSNQYRWNQCSNPHKDSGDGTHGLWIFKANAAATNTGIPGYSPLTDVTELTSGEKYLIAGKGADGNFYLLNPVVNTSNYYAHVAKVTGTTAQKTVKSTEITFQGLAVGQTTVLVGTTLYTVNVGNSPDCFVMRNVSAVTILNTVPTLPATVCGVLQDGTLVQNADGSNYQYPVVWDAVTADMFDTVGEIVTVNGTVTISDGNTKAVTCTVRVVDTPAIVDVVDANTNLSEDLPSGVTAADNLNSLKDGNTNPGDDANNRWSNWNYRNSHTTATITLNWGEVKTIDLVKLYFRDDNGSDLPTSVTFRYSTDGVNYNEITATKSDLSAINKSYTFSQPVDAQYLQVVLGHDAGRGVAMYEIEVFTALMAGVTINSSADLSNLTVDGTTVSGFDADVHQYTVMADENANVAAFTDAAVNAGITVLPIYDGVVRVLTVSEDGTEAKTYEITYQTSTTEYEKEVNLNVGQTVTITDDTGNYENDVHKANNFDQVARLEVSGSDITETTVSTAVSALESGKKYVIVNANNSDVLHNTGNGTHLRVDTDFNADNLADADIWTLENVTRVTDANGNTVSYTANVKDKDGNYLSFSSSGSGVGSTAATVEFEVGSNFNNSWRIECTNAYLNPQNGFAKTYGGNGSNSGDNGNHWYLYEVTTTLVSSTTTITFTGVAEGDTSVVIGDTTYKVHVRYAPETIPVQMYIGESKEYIVEGNIYDSATNSDETVASVTLTPDAVTDDNRLRQVTELRSGAKYLIETNIGTKVLLNGTANDGGLLLSGTKSADSTQVWTIEEYDNGHSVSIMVNGVRKYLAMTGDGSATLVDAPVALQVKYNGTNWTIAQGNCYLNRYGGQGSTKAAGWINANASTGAGSMWNIYEVVNQNRTHVTITGNKVGNTTIVVGHVTYEVEVINEVVDVEMFVGETQHFSADRVKFGNANVTVDDPSVALVTVQAKPVSTGEITAEANLVVGKQYVFMNNSANKALTNVASGNTLVLNGTTDNLGQSMIWTLTAFDPNTGVAKLQDANGKYLNFGAATASVGGDFELILNREDGGYWTIRTNTAEVVYLNNAGRRGVADGYRNGTPTEDICQWSVYEADTAAADAGTVVTITGLKPGEAVATVGHVTYNITVKEIVKNVEIFVGETWTDSINGISENGTYNNDHVSATWKDIGIREGVGQLLNANGEITSSIGLSEAELTFTLSNGKYKIATAGGKFLDISGYPFDDAFEEANDYVSLSFGADGAVRLVNLEGHYLQVYTGNGAPEWSWKTALTGTITDDAFAFYIYEAVENARDSSAEIPGYRKITSADEITSGESYLVAFVKDGTYYVAHYTGTSGKNANMARISTTQTGSFTDVSIVGNHVGEATVKFNGVTYNVTVKPFEKNFSLEIDATRSYKAHECVTQDQVDEFNANYGTVVTAELKDGNLVFTGVAEGSVKAYLLGDNRYTITVTPVLAHPDDTKYVGGQQDTQGEGQKITGLIISNDTIYDLNLDASMDGKNITWRSSDENLFTVDGNGTVTTKGNGGDGYISIYDDGVLYQIIPIHVIETNKTGNTRVIDIYNSEVINCTAYYTLNEGEIHEFPKGYQIFVNHTMSETDLITFYATPDEGHALTYINSVGGTWFHPVVNKEGTDYLVDGEHNDGLTMRTEGYITLHDQLIAYVANNSGAADADTIHAMLDNAVALQIDGAFFFSRATNTNNIVTSTTFVAEKLPTVDKSVNGILGTSGLQVDFKTYTEGMYAEVGQHIYFNVTVEVTAPLFWERAMQSNKAYTPAANYAGVVVDTSGFVVTKNADGVWERALDAEGNPYTPAEGADVLMVDSQGYVLVVDANGRPVPALRYTASNLADNLKGAYFYTKELDLDDDVDGDGIFYEGFLAPSEQKTAHDITAELNRTWTAEELAAGKRVLEYFVVYPIQPSDLNKNIENTVDLDYVYTTVYSDGLGESVSQAAASMIVLGQSFGDVVIDFGLPIVKTGLTETALPGITPENYKTFEANTNAAQGGCKYGTVEITYDAESKTYNLIYTPNTVLPTYDVIYIMDADNNLVNYIRVRPASTVYYEESFAELNNAIGGELGWSAVAPITGAQEYEDVGCVKHDHDNFGYDEKYAGETGMSNGSELISSNSGDTATFTFNGTGFDIYANCDPDSSVVAVLVYRMRSTTDEAGNATQKEELTKFFQVATKIKAGDTGATEYEGVTYADGSVIVSVTDLEHGTYKVVIRHTKKVDGTDTRKFYLDGFRIYNTLKDGDQYYPINEKRVIFTELRDEVLFAAGVTADSTQTYNRESNYVSTTAPGATVAFLRDSENAVLEENVQDWLNNGPKNEIWMKSNDSLVFTLYAGDPDTQAGAIANAQLGLKAPTGEAVVVITLSNGRTWVATKEYTITSATDMFYELPETDSGMINGLTVTVTVEKGMVSITKLKANVYEGGVATVSPLSMMDDLDIASALNVLYPTNDDNGETTDPSDPDDGTTTDPSDPDDGTTTDPSDPDDGETTDPSDPDDGETTDPSDPSDDDLPDAGVDVYKDTVNRIFGENRFETAFKVADELKAVLGIEKFKNIIIASGTNFADALSGTYLASVKNAPILLSYNEVYNDMVREYIAENLAEDGTVYILGGNAAVPYTMDLELIADGITIKRLAGADRFATNLAILAEAGVKGGEILVCTGSNFADSLSASATGKPILLVYNESGELSVAQKLYLTMLDRANFTIIGGEKAISAELEEAVSAYGVTNRLAGANRFETSVAIAEAYFTDPQDLVLAYAGNYPDGLCGGALAYAINAPLVLTMSGYETEADAYADAFDVQGGVVLGGSGLISDDSVVEIFGLEKPEEIIVK